VLDKNSSLISINAQIFSGLLINALLYLPPLDPRHPHHAVPCGSTDGSIPLLRALDERSFQIWSTPIIPLIVIVVVFMVAHTLPPLIFTPFSAILPDPAVHAVHLTAVPEAVVFSTSV
jgi:hypothetical protein